MTDCEACQGPGKAHIEEGDPKKIISFKNKPAKETSETCLACHAGREEHNNFRRGERWRNDVGVTIQHPVDLGGLADHKCGACHKPNEPFKHPVNLGDISMFQCVECHPLTKPSSGMRD